MSGRGWRRWAPWVAVAALALVLWGYRSALERANRRVERLEPHASRAQVRDQLMGTDLSGVSLLGLDGGEHALAPDEGRRLVWLVDPYQCARCLEQQGAWSLADRAEAFSVSLVLVGAGREKAAAIRRSAGIRGSVLLDPGRRLAGTLGLTPRLPSLFLVLGEDGTVLMSEARQAEVACDWSFPGQVAALLADGGGGLLRLAAR